jgi:hypothetical protein
MWPKAINICSILNESNTLNALLQCHMTGGCTTADSALGSAMGVATTATTWSNSWPNAQPNSQPNLQPNHWRHVPTMTFLTALLFYLHSSVPTLHYSCGAFLLCDHSWCGLMQPLTYMVNHFSYILLTFPSPTIVPVFLDHLKYSVGFQTQHPSTVVSY